MSARLWLHPNLGAEDERPLSVVDPALAGSLARTWALLFASDAVLDGAEAVAPERPTWMSREDEPAFAFLEGVRGFLPWLSTSDAEARASALGLPYAACPSGVARRVSDKAWALEAARELALLPPELEEVLCALAPEELSAPDARARVDERLSRWPASLRESFTLKPRFGSSGRGRVKGRGGRLDDAGAAALPRLSRRGGAVLEPWLARVEDLSAQAFVDESGRAHFLGSTRQVMTPAGVWLGNLTHLEDDGTLRAGSSHDDALERAVLLVAERAAHEGFRGSLGLDAFLYRTAEGEVRWRPVVEVNARFTMGLVTLGLARRAERAGWLRRGRACAFHARARGPSPLDVERLPLPQGALDVARQDAAYEALSAALLTGGSPKAR